MTVMNEEFEPPIFKLMSKTDADEGDSNVAGILITKPMRAYFPLLPTPSAAHPAPATSISIVMILPGAEPIAAPQASYQYQTRGNSRTPESRLTGVEPLRDAASKGDYVLFERSLERDDLFRLTLVRKGEPRHGALHKMHGSSKSGIVDPATAPLKLTLVAEAEAEIEASSSGPFQLFDPNTQWKPSGRRVARAKAFARLVAAAYENKCAICGGGLAHPKGRTEVEAAHIVTRGERGADDVRNGLALCRAHHWAFDNYLIGFRANGSIALAPAAATMIRNGALAAISGKKLRKPKDRAQAPHPDALQWASDRFDAYWDG